MASASRDDRFLVEKTHASRLRREDVCLREFAGACVFVFACVRTPWVPRWHPSGAFINIVKIPQIPCRYLIYLPDLLSQTPKQQTIVEGRRQGLR